MAVALLVAAGRGERLGADGPKAFVVLAGRPMLEWSLDALRLVPAVERIVVALPAGGRARDRHGQARAGRGPARGRDARPQRPVGGADAAGLPPRRALARARTARRRARRRHR